MDEMKIVSKFTRNMISKILKVMLKKKSGYNVDIQINDVNVTINEGKRKTCKILTDNSTIQS